MTQRKRGGQPGNRNALKTGEHTKDKREERRQQAERRREKAREWQKLMDWVYGRRPQ